MRTWDDLQRRWTSLFDTSIGVDLRQAVRDGEGADPCEDGLRSICWKAFLLYGPLSQGSWSKKMAESRATYASLRDHFLRFIEHPNDLDSSTDPLADDESSPWSTLRHDEIHREEIFQDVTRCMQDNYFFREPATQKQMLDILFIYAKLNPDIGYRQGMHELLAPILWVVQHDAVDTTAVPRGHEPRDGVDFMLEVLELKHVEHDTFSLFCAVMQTAKIYYEPGDTKDASPIITRSQQIQHHLLALVDPDLALHLQVIGILPQIYAIRWIRLLFGREFDFTEVLRMWDLLFAENLRSDVVDLTCVSLLLRAHWSLIDADYTAAITQLTRYSRTHDPRSLVRDALQLEKSSSADAGAAIIRHHTGRALKSAETASGRGSPAVEAAKPPPPPRPVPAAPATKVVGPQTKIEGLLQEVTGTLQRRTEGWNVSRAVRTAVGEVRRNMNSYQTSHSRQSSLDAASVSQPRRSSEAKREGASQPTQTQTQHTLHHLVTRNLSLADKLADALKSLQAVKLATSTPDDDSGQRLNLALAQLQIIYACLSNPEMPIPREDAGVLAPTTTVSATPQAARNSSTTLPLKPLSPSGGGASPGPRAPMRPQTGATSASTPVVAGRDAAHGSRHAARPSLMDASFSFMLGDGRHRSSFVSSVSDLPEQRRDSESKSRPKQLVTAEQQQRRGSESEDDGFTLTKMQGGPRS